MRFHKIANVNKALDYICSKGVKLVSIGAEGESPTYLYALVPAPSPVLLLLLYTTPHNITSSLPPPNFFF